MELGTFVTKCSLATMASTKSALILISYGFASPGRRTSLALMKTFLQTQVLSTNSDPKVNAVIKLLHGKHCASDEVY